MIEITFLGTSGTVPTKEKNQHSVHLKFRGNNMLFDCGEGTQRQMALAGVSPYKIQNIFISHLHADHLLGLGGLVQTLNLMKRDDALEVYGPKGIKRHVDFQKSWDYFEAGYEINTHEIKKDGLVFENQEYSVRAFSVDHSCPCYGYVFEEKKEPNLDKKKLKKLGLLNNPICRELKAGKAIKWEGKTIRPEDVTVRDNSVRKVGIVVDANPSEKIINEVSGCDLLIMEGTFSDKIKDKAHDYGHMTAKDAATIAKKSGAKRLILTHFSARYDDVSVLRDEARKMFRNTDVAEDLMRVNV